MFFQSELEINCDVMDAQKYRNALLLFISYSVVLDFWIQ